MLVEEGLTTDRCLRVKHTFSHPGFVWGSEVSLPLSRDEAIPSLYLAPPTLGSVVRRIRKREKVLHSLGYPHGSGLLKL